jgi:hypothetical protein
MKNVHLLPTDKSSRLYLHSENELQLRTNIIRTSEDYLGSNQHIYITSDEEIKEGEYVIEDIGGVVYGPIDRESIVENPKKIILTTDQDLIADGVQAIDDEFLEWFVQNPSCEEVEVELVALNEHGSEISVNSYGFEKFGYKIIIPKEEVKKIYYNTVGRENGVNVVKGQFNTQKEALDLANELNRKYPDLYYDWRKTLIKEEPKQETLEEAAERLSKNAYKKHSVKDDKLSLDEQIQRSGGFIVGFKEGMIEGAKWLAEQLSKDDAIQTLEKGIALLLRKQEKMYNEKN